MLENILYYFPISIETGSPEKSIDTDMRRRAFPLAQQFSGPSCSKHRQLNELVSCQNVNCSRKYNI